MYSQLTLQVSSKSFKGRIQSRAHCSSFLSVLLLCCKPFNRNSSSSSSSRWRDRQSNDVFAREAKVQRLKSRAAFKLLEAGLYIDSKYHLFKKGQTVVDLVAVERTKPNGRVLGIDIIPAQPPKGACAIQGNFLSRGVQNEAIRFLSKPDRGRLKSDLTFQKSEPASKFPSDFLMQEQSFNSFSDEGSGDENRKNYRGVDVVLSDMSEPWMQTTGFWKRTLSDPYRRMMNTSGINLKDHVGSMELCRAALEFAKITLRTGGHFVCKFYQGDEDKELERNIKQAFRFVHREKPESSRKESNEAYFVALRMTGIQS
ncbi:rRNA methyltransferase 2, mitochondrial [Golovinomyces cichoracearum]|uniref:rRNA methyltransferase 2, mitochondrial n=1 Tax=Golovinomyces cichoracearum TaxID=62708 RepID=A0A420IFE7_9PEZI|nr:rRNA methyltransferase 2, mitochondrial [Golovinomyces cichoracearum]